MKNLIPKNNFSSDVIMKTVLPDLEGPSEGTCNELEMFSTRELAYSFHHLDRLGSLLFCSRGNLTFIAWTHFGWLFSLDTQFTKKKNLNLIPHFISIFYFSISFYIMSPETLLNVIRLMTRNGRSIVLTAVFGSHLSLHVLHHRVSFIFFHFYFQTIDWRLWQFFYRLRIAI